MATTQNLSLYIKKLCHPVKEIRERALQLLIAKLELGWKLEDELSSTRELLNMLLSWFHEQQPTLQKQALCLLQSSIKTKAGTYIAREYGVVDLISKLYSFKKNIEPEAIELFNDIVETLQFLNTVHSEDSIGVPRLNIPSVSSSSDSVFGLDNGSNNSEQISDNQSQSQSDMFSDRFNKMESKNYIIVFLFPWNPLSSSDKKTLILVEDALRLFKSVKRCCRFIHDVFIQDFPAETFLNRPNIIQNLLSMISGNYNDRHIEAVNVLLCITRALRRRLQQLVSPDLIHVPKKINDSTKGSAEEIQVELDEIIGDVDECAAINTPQEDKLTLLRQMPSPYYALDTLHTILSLMVQNVHYIDSNEKNEILNMNELNTYNDLIEELFELLFDCVDKGFWQIEHNTKTHRDIAHKSCMVMRLLADVINKYSITFWNNTEFVQYRITWLRLIACAEKLLLWINNSSLPPSSLGSALHTARLDPSLSLLYPSLTNKINMTIQNFGVVRGDEFNRKYKELTKYIISMEDTVRFMKDKDFCRSDKNVLRTIKSSLPLLELHQSETYLNDVSKILLTKIHDWKLCDEDWSEARNIVLTLIAHNLPWVRESFYRKMYQTVKLIFEGGTQTKENEKCLTLFCDVGILTEICCHGLYAKNKEVEQCVSNILMYLLRGRLLLSESFWWRLLASLLPVLPLLHCYAAHDTQLGQAICKSLELDIAECMGVSHLDVIMGLVRLLFVRCPSVQMDAAHSICHLLDDDKYLPPKESLRADVLVSALRRVQPDDFNIDRSYSSTKSTQQTTGLMQILDVLKQDIHYEGDNMDLTECSAAPSLEASLRRSTLQQLALLMQQPDLHEKFVEYDGLKIVIAILRISLYVDDYLAFPECALSCVSVLNSVCYENRHTLAKINDLASIIIRVILVFPSNDSLVLMATQVLSVMAWSGFALLELNDERKRVLALPSSVVERTTLPFLVQSYWETSPNTEHSSLEWLLSEDNWRAAIRVRWACAWNGPARLLRAPAAPPGPPPARLTDRDLALLQTLCPLHSGTRCLMALQNATSHRQVDETLALLESYCRLLGHSSVELNDFGALPWMSTMSRFLAAAPASPKDIALLISLLKFIITYIKYVQKLDDKNCVVEWIMSSFLDSSNSMISLLCKDRLFPQQTIAESIEVTQLHIYIVRVLLHCVILLEREHKYDSAKLESLLKIILSCLQKVDLKNFHMLGYLNELVKCIRYITNSRHCDLSEGAVANSMRALGRAARAGRGGGGGGRKGQACALDAMLGLLALLRHAHRESFPVQNWGDVWSGEMIHSVVACISGARVELRAVSLELLSNLAHYPQLLPHLQQAVPYESLAQLAAAIFSETSEANIVRTGAASILAAISARTSHYAEIIERDIIEQLYEYNFLDHTLQILTDFCKRKKQIYIVEPNVPVSLLERYSELEVRSQKSTDFDINICSTSLCERAPPTAQLVGAVARVVHNVIGFDRCPAPAWNEAGLFRLLFRCSWWGAGGCARAAAGACAYAALARAASAHKCVRAALADTKDCLHSLLFSLNPSHLEECERECVEAITQGVLLISVLLSEKSASECIWEELTNGYAATFFNLLLRILVLDDQELQTAGLFCLNQLMQSVCQYKGNMAINDFIDNMKCTYTDENVKDTPRNIDSEGGTDDCYPEYMVEEVCRTLIGLYRNCTNNNKIELTQDDFWVHICSCLASVLSRSERARTYAVHRNFPIVLLASLQVIRDHLSLHGKPVEVIRKANTNPILYSLYWILVVIDSSLTNCKAAKESFADNNISNSLNRLWPWCMLTEHLRNAVVHLLHTFTNRCPKAWSSMTQCVSGRNLVAEVSAVAAREAALLSRAHSPLLLGAALDTLRHCAPHHHAAALVLKGEALSSVNRLRVVSGGGGGGGGGGGAGGGGARWEGARRAWRRLAEALSRRAEGGAHVLALRPAPPAALLLPALALAAHHHRTTFLQTADLLDLLSGACLNGDVSQLVWAGRAIWALAANNHKAKLKLRSAGVSAAVHSALERLQRARRDASAECALQLLTYLDSMLQAT